MKEQLNKFLDEYCEKNQLTGSLRITSHDEVVFERFIGKATPEGEDINRDSMFTLYSMSKPFCAIGLMKLYEKGLVDINAHPEKYLPEAKGFPKDLKIYHLLHHIAGLPDFFTTPDFKEHVKNKTPLREQVALMTKYPIKFEPGKGNLYANINFNIQALIIENVSGMKYADYMKKEVFEPFGMKTALVDSEGLSVKNRVMGREEGGEWAERTMDWMFGGGDIVGTIDDVYCLNKAIKNCVMLKKETWEEILTPSEVNGMGKGCRISLWHGKKRITHNGGHVGFRTLHIQLPEDDFDIIFLSNSGFGNARDDISEAIYNIYYGEDNIDSEKIEMDKGYI